ncbi:MAG: PEP/pyruvate-binding domain-containing protein [Synechococcaceae cyanobacterium]|nr:PEP/pyruvate-binding domain-containing protein [Synechococcaceae cyanobacterium]
MTMRGPGRLWRWLEPGRDDGPAGADLGGKAATLARLAGLGYPVWPGVVLLPAATGCAAAAGRGAAAALEPGAGARRLPPALLAELLEALQRLAAEVGAAAPLRLAVRSSAALEDGREHSFAGQFSTALNVPPEGLAGAIEQVWASAEAAALGRYVAESAGGTGVARAGVPAVLLQPMLPARVAGVAFAADPVSAQRGVTLIQAVPGLADALVAGQVNGEHWRLDRHGALLEHRPLDPAAPLLTPAQSIALARLVRDLSHRLGSPHDVEWALGDDGRFWLLQARPITALRRRPDPDGAPGLWDNSNLVESYGGVTTPLTFSFARRAYTEVYTRFCRFMGVDDATVRRHRAVFATMIGFHNGRLYYNLRSWYKVLSLLPGYDLNAGFLEQMLGVREQLTAAQRRELRLEPPRGVAASLLRLAGSGGALVLNAFTLERRRRAFRRRLDRCLLSPAQRVGLADARPDELVACYRRIEAELLNRWDAPLINDFYAMVAYGLLGGLLRRWRLDPDGTHLNGWISDLGAVVSAEPPRRIRAMARQLRDQPVAVEALCRGGAPDIARALQSLPALRAELEAYLDDFGDRCLEELKLETPTLRDDPLPLLRSLGGAARGIADAEPPAAAGFCAAPWPSLDPLRGLLLGWLRRRLRRLVAERENLRFERTRVFGLARRLLLELGRRYAALGLLEQPEDAVFLEVEELLAMVEGNGSCGDLRGLVAVRRAEWERHRQAPPLPRRFRCHDLPSLALPDLLAAAPGPSTAPGLGACPDVGAWQGVGCAPGRVRGPVSLVRDPRRWLETPPPAGAVRPILVATATDPGWVLLFPHAAGLLVERGSVLSHVAIVARELGLPMVTELPAIGAALADGDWVEFDGAAGTVRRLPAPQGAS